MVICGSAIATPDGRSLPEPVGGGAVAGSGAI